MSSRTSKVLRSRAQHTSSLRQPLSTVIASSQPTIRAVQPSPRITRSRPARNRRVLTQPLSVNLSDSPTHDPDGLTANEGTIVNNNTTGHHIEHVVCPLCAMVVQDGGNGLMCGRCDTWFHPECLYLTEEEFTQLCQSNESWHCDHCKSIMTNRIKWGKFDGEENIVCEIQAAYHEITSWKKNIFLLPRGKAATDFIKELTRLINLFLCKSKWERLALPLLHVLMPIMLQKPSKKSKAKDHAKYLSSRLQKWSNGDLHSLMAECREIQRRLISARNHKAETDRKAFCRHMLMGNVKKAMSFINNNDDVRGVHTVTNDIKELLQNKHPKAEPADPDALLNMTSAPAELVIFENITADLIKRSTKLLQGSGGPTLIDCDVWKHIICCKSYGADSHNLAEAIANLAKRLCCEHIHPGSLKELMSSRLIPLDKGPDSHGNPGVRPIGIGEVLRRIIGKSVVYLLKSDIQKAAGCLQMCTGLRSGIEAAVHMTHKVWHDDTTEAMLLVDANNAFNRLNRQVALHNIKQLCPPFHTFLYNCYQVPTDLTLNNTSEHSSLSSEEGCTQGDTAAMAFYSVGIKPLVDHLDDTIKSECCKQSWYADDSSASGKLTSIKKWWDMLNVQGPKYGYFPNPCKTVLLLKDPDNVLQAEALFSNSGVQIKIDGHRYLGAAIGKASFVEEYVKEKVTKWIKDIKELSKYAVDEPQIALSAYTKGVCHRWAFIQRTIPGISSLFAPLEDCLRETFIPSIIGRNISDTEREIVSLPVRYGGLGIPNPVETCEREYNASLTVTHDLADLIYNQIQDISLFDSEKQEKTIKDLKKNKETILSNTFKDIVESIDDVTLKRALILSSERGSGSWLTVLPLKDHGYCLNKQEFRDALCLRYGWRIPKTPSFCGCGQRNTVDHTLICKKGGYVAMRHNNLRDLNAEMQREVCRDVVVEPPLLPLDGEDVQGTQGDRSAPDISSRGLWSTFERTFFDVRVFHPNAPSYRTADLDKLYKNHEHEKMRKYNSRVMTVERGSFTPLIYTTFGGWGPQTTRYHKRLAEKLARKRNEEYSHVLSHMRSRIRFSLLRSVLVAVRGERGKKQGPAIPFSSTSFNLIPDTPSYESL